MHLIGFCDASTKGYAAAVYLCITTLQNTDTYLLLKGKVYSRTIVLSWIVTLPHLLKIKRLGLV